MAKGLTEEQVTGLLIQWLENNGWEIIAFDFPQSGTGVYLHPENTTSKNLKSIVPDIVAYRGGIVVYFENKDHFDLADFMKVSFLRQTNEYDKAFSKLLGSRQYERIYYGIGLPLRTRIKQRALGLINLIDFLVLVDHSSVEIHGSFTSF